MVNGVWEPLVYDARECSTSPDLWLKLYNKYPSTRMPFFHSDTAICCAAAALGRMKQIMRFRSAHRQRPTWVGCHTHRSGSKCRQRKRRETYPELLTAADVGARCDLCVRGCWPTWRTPLGFFRDVRLLDGDFSTAVSQCYERRSAGHIQRCFAGRPAAPRHFTFAVGGMMHLSRTLTTGQGQAQLW